MSRSPWNPPPRYLFRKYNIIRQVKKLPVKTFIDVGCGAGDLACTLVKELEKSGTGVDYADSAIKIANELKAYFKLGKQPAFKLIGGDSLKKLNKADMVMCLEVLEHVKDDEKFLKELASLSKRFVIISVPAKKSLFSHSDRLAGHYRRYEKKELTRLLNKNGLNIVSFISYGYPFTNMIRVIRELFAARRKSKTKPSSKISGTKKSGTDLLNINKYFASWLKYIIYPLYSLSLIFNESNLSEGYLVVCEKQA